METFFIDVQEKQRRTNAGGCCEVGFVSHVTVTAEGSDGVDAPTVTAQIRHHLALVDVWKRGEITEDGQAHRETQHQPRALLCPVLQVRIVDNNK